MSNKRKLLIGLIVLVTIAVILVVLLVPGDTTTRAVALLSFVITVGKVAYDIFDKERDRKKKAEESRERVRATAKYGHWDSTGEELGVVIYNEGSTPVHIQSVNCYYRRGDGSDVQQVGLDNMGHQETELLQPKHVAKFRYGLFKEDVLREIASLPKEDVWITINSYQGEICRVSGEDIIRVLNSQPTSQVG